MADTIGEFIAPTLEPVASALAKSDALYSVGADKIAVLSMAISLKRIADIVQAVNGPLLPSLFGQFEDLAYRMGQAFEGGRRNGG